MKPGVVWSAIGLMTGLGCQLEGDPDPDPLDEVASGAVALEDADHESAGPPLGPDDLVVELPTSELGPPSDTQVPLDPATIPMFAHELPIVPTFAPTVIMENGEVVRHEYTVTVGQAQVQMLPPGFPTTTVVAYGGDVAAPGGGTQFVRTVPGPVFDNIRGIPAVVHWRNEVGQPFFLPIDPTLHWANPLNLEPPEAPFAPFPTGYTNAQYPLGVVTHNHGLVVTPNMDGVAEQWFTQDALYRGPSFETRDYFEPNEQPSTMLFYHDHAMGITRVTVYAGLVGAGYIIRDPDEPLDQPTSPLPQGEFEIPLTFQDKSFFTDGELNFPRVSSNLKNAYWQPGDGANVILVNGKVWPNLDVQRRQYRFRMLAAGNGRRFTVTLDNDGTTEPFTIIGSDGGYLPQPQVVDSVAIATTERADILVDFSQFEPGTHITMRNAGASGGLGTMMQFTVLGGPAVTPPPLTPFPERPTLTPNAPLRIKTMQNHIDADGDAMRSVDGLEFTRPATEYPLVGSTEEWDIVNIGGGPHQIHLHLIEFQLVDRQAIDSAAYLEEWHLRNGFRPVTRPIVVDPTPFLIGDPIPPTPYETGWKDTIRANSGQVMRLVARWAPQEVPPGGVAKGENLFPIDPASGSSNSWFLWHCHVLGHEDNDMLRKLPLVDAWTTGVSYARGVVVAHNDINYRVRIAHNSSPFRAPNLRFDLWERVNNNDGSWAPQIIYAVGDRVLHQGELFRALEVHQAQPMQTPDSSPCLWEEIPLDPCEQLEMLCADGTDPVAMDCEDIGQAGDDTACRDDLAMCLAVCDTDLPSPCSGLCDDPVAFTVDDYTSFQSGPLGTGAACFETESELLSGTCSSFSGGRELRVNGTTMPCNAGNWTYPLPPQRNNGYCIQTTPGGHAYAAFATW